VPVDMHVHTTASDGADKPGEVVARARRLGLEALAVTDHDTLEGIEPAMAAGRLYRVEVVPGIELSTMYGNGELHVLGYLMDLHCRDFLDRISLFRCYRVGRIKKMVSKLNELGIPVDLERVMAISGSGSVGRPHLAAAMVEIGAVADIAEAFDKYIGTECPAYVPRFKMEPVEAVRLILAAGGIPVLAHPGLSNSSELIPYLAREGLIGLEAYHPAHSWELSAYYCRLAEEYGLITTGGSDYHGKEHREGAELGMRTVPYAVLQEMKNRLRKF